MAGAKLVVVLGHTRCGAVNAAVQATCDPNLEVAPDCVHLAPIMEYIGRAVEPADCSLPADAPPERRYAVADEVAARNVARVVAEVRRRSQVIEGLVREGRVGFVGLLYDVASGGTWVVPGTAAGFPTEGLSSKTWRTVRPGTPE